MLHKLEIYYEIDYLKAGIGKKIGRVSLPACQ